MDIKIVSEQQLKYIKSEFEDLVKEIISKKYVFEGCNYSIFENLILFYDNDIFEKIREEHYLSMTNGQRIWNKLFWYLRYKSDISKIGGDAGSHIQPIAKILEELYNSDDQINDLDIEPFFNFASDFENQEYIMFDYFHPAITDTGISIKSEELKNIIDLLDISEINLDKIDCYIEKNIDNTNAEIFTYRNKNNKNIFISIDTFSASEDQIHPIEILINCKFADMETADNELVKWWERFWKKMGPFVAISPFNKFERNRYFERRIRIEK